MIENLHQFLIKYVFWKIIFLLTCCMHILNNDITPAASHNCASLTKSTRLAADTSLWFTKEPVPNWWLSFRLPQETKPLVLTVSSLSHLTSCTPTNSIYILLISWPLLLLSVNLPNTVSLNSTYQISCPLSTSQVVPEDQSRSETHVSVS
jgi:hypothetical protein